MSVAISQGITLMAGAGCHVARHQPVPKGLLAATVTDDCEQVLLPGRILVKASGRFEHTPGLRP
ncbi:MULTISPECIES: hypothetical protein [unclassified Mesorhizobium]|uniref:hypothetical protein n=1 Tax=unclassified Mesorhizobium TaxID=325217 RepID=UPI00112B08AB|nr:MULTISPECIES: hypothetical protein [unclassified Mesorhizobium]MBZ9808826.1 hypothetical protein [Mesorhizobium sp. ESP-6-2]TPM32393.1 hypothetical protein FJ955_07335 [Mesorhizobium sp. B2-2-2]